MENGIEFFAAWVGLSKIGVITAWINTNLKAEPLAHSIRVAKCKAVLTTPTQLPVLMAAVRGGLLPSGLRIYVSSLDGQIVAEEEDNDIDKAEQRQPLRRREHTLANPEEPQIPKSLNFQSNLVGKIIFKLIIII
jgi:acyl-CoA synthetase (AMP-forming)/AMP-acid ligase II